MSEEKTSRPARCEKTLALGAELALGSANGAERSAALSHLDLCDSCRSEVAALAAAADQLWQLAPECEPPVGFEVRLAERLGAKFHPRPRRLRLAVAAMALLLGGAGAGAVVTAAVAGSPAASRSAESPRLAALVVPAGGRGVAALEPGHPAHLVMRIEGLSGAYWVSCVVTGRHGRHENLGRFALMGGAGHWSVRLPASLSPAAVTSAELLGEGGVVLARARFSTRLP